MGGGGGSAASARDEHTNTNAEATITSVSHRCRGAPSVAPGVPTATSKETDCGPRYCGVNAGPGFAASRRHRRDDPCSGRARGLPCARDRWGDAMRNAWCLLGVVAGGCGGCSEPPVQSGVVKDVFGHPLEGATVIMEGVLEQKLTNAQGEFTFPRQKTSMRITAGKKGYIKDTELATPPVEE